MILSMLCFLGIHAWRKDNDNWIRCDRCALMQIVDGHYVGGPGTSRPLSEQSPMPSLRVSPEGIALTEGDIRREHGSF